MSTTTTVNTDIITGIINGFLALLGFQITSSGVKPPSLETLLSRIVVIVVTVMFIMMIIKVLMKVI